MQTSALFGEKP